MDIDTDARIPAQLDVRPVRERSGRSDGVEDGMRRRTA
jgi:hypothetical protein